jgi:catechol 2,3-dioxygenase-like lactoylglutathione lyase family enzyme
MQVDGINHVNIVADDLDATVRFYETVVGLKAKLPPMVSEGFQGRWLCDAKGDPIIHVLRFDAERHGGRTLGPELGAIDHVALTCRDYDGMVARCDDLAVVYRTNDLSQFGLRQIFVTDPNDVLLELNFPVD